MFEQTFVNAQAQSRKSWTIAVSLTLEVGFVAAILIVPLLHPGTIRPRFDFHTPVLIARLEPPPLAPETRQSAITVPKPRGVFVNPLLPPRMVPNSIDMTPDPAPEISGVPMTSAVASALAEFAAVRPLTPPTPPTIAVKPQPAAAPVAVGGDVQSAKLINSPKPGYPPIAKTTRVQGTVRMEAIIGRDGAIRNLRVTSGPPLLIGAALQAVAQWRYRPTLLNGEPVEVITEIDVNFALN